jgi:mRNA-degrading endonuclease HigB of HigAB toxin-antitoxin module
VILLELSSVDQSFANAVKMLLIKGQNDGVAKLPMQELVQRLNRMGFSASNQIDAIRGLISTFKAKNNDLVADVSNNEIMLTTMPTADTVDQSEKNKETVGKDAVKQARKDLGL